MGSISNSVYANRIARRLRIPFRLGKKGFNLERKTMKRKTNGVIVVLTYLLSFLRDMCHCCELALGAFKGLQYGYTPVRQNTPQNDNKGDKCNQFRVGAFFCCSGGYNSGLYRAFGVYESHQHDDTTERQNGRPKGIIVAMAPFLLFCRVYLSFYHVGVLLTFKNTSCKNFMDEICHHEEGLYTEAVVSVKQ